MDWTRRRRCADAEPDLFYPRAAELYSDALAFCEACPVKTECLNAELAFMIANPDEDTHGMWGGSTPPQRRRMVQFGMVAA